MLLYPFCNSCLILPSFWWSDCSDSVSSWIVLIVWSQMSITAMDIRLQTLVFTFAFTVFCEWHRTVAHINATLWFVNKILVLQTSVTHKYVWYAFGGLCLRSWISYWISFLILVLLLSNFTVFSHATYLCAVNVRIMVLSCLYCYSMEWASCLTTADWHQVRLTVLTYTFARVRYWLRYVTAGEFIHPEISQA